jgi:anthranilate phosphoribosyltransferase
MAEALRDIGSCRSWVVHGHGGLDEISLTGKSVISCWDGNRIYTFELDPRKYDFALCTDKDLAGGTPKENAEIALEVLRGRKGPKRDIVLLNAAAAVYLAGRADSYSQAIDVCRQSIDTGAAMQRLEDLRDYSRRA